MKFKYKSGFVKKNCIISAGRTLDLVSFILILLQAYAQRYFGYFDE